MTTFFDPIQEGLQLGWKVFDASQFQQNQRFTADIAIIGTGAGGGIAAEMFSNAGFQVVLIEEGPLKSSRDFKMQEKDAYAELYQEAAARKTKDKAIAIFQGRCVGGSTTVNWSTCFRTPPATLQHWTKEHQLEGFTPEEMEIWFQRIEERLSIGNWQTAPNPNNQLLALGAERMNLHSGRMQRNVKGCLNLGYCGFGCPTNAKQSMLVTTIPAALNRGAILITRARAERFTFKENLIENLECQPLTSDGIHPSPFRCTVQAKHYILSGGAIGSPALLIRSHIPDPYHRVGRRTFLHPSSGSFALMKDAVKPFYGAPQSVYSDHFLMDSPHKSVMGYKLEAAPLHPMVTATVLSDYGTTHAEWMKGLDHTHSLIALARDGFHEESQGGSVELNDQGLPVLHYPISEYLWDGIRRSLLNMARIQFEAGAEKVLPLHHHAKPYSSWQEAQAAIKELPMRPVAVRLFSAHVMGGCSMGKSLKIRWSIPGGNTITCLTSLSSMDLPFLPVLELILSLVFMRWLPSRRLI